MLETLESRADLKPGETIPIADVALIVAPRTSEYYCYLAVKPEAGIKKSWELIGFDGIKPEELPTVAFGLRRTERSGNTQQIGVGTRIIGRVETDSDGDNIIRYRTTSENGTLDRIAFRYDAFGDLSLDPIEDGNRSNTTRVIEYGILNNIDGQESETEEKLEILKSNYPGPNWDEYNDFITAKTGLSMFEMTAALTRIYYTESPLEDKKARYKTSEEFITVRTKIPPEILPLIIILTGMEWRKAMETKLLPAPEEVPLLMPGLEPEIHSVETQISNKILAKREEWIAAINDEGALSALVKEISGDGFTDRQIKKEAAIVLLNLVPSKSIQSVLKNLHTGGGELVLAELSEESREERIRLNRLKSSNPQNPNIARVKDPVTGEQVNISEWIHQHSEEILSGAISVSQLREWFEPETTKTSIYKHLRRAFPNDYESIKGIRIAEREELLQSIFTNWTTALRAGRFEAVTALAERMGIDKNSLNQYFKVRLETEPDVKELRRQAIARRRTESISGSPKQRLGGVSYGSYREAMMSLLLMLYQNYLPLEGINYQTGHIDPKGSLRRIDFKLYSQQGAIASPIEYLFVEFGPAIRRKTAAGAEYLRHGGDQEAYLKGRRKLIESIPNARLSDLTSLSELPKFLKKEFDIDLPKEIAEKMNTFERSRVSLGSKKQVLISDGVKNLFSSPELLMETFHPELKGMINVFIRLLPADTSLKGRIRALYPEVGDEEFNRVLTDVKIRLEAPQAFLRKMQRNRRNEMLNRYNENRRKRQKSLQTV